MIYNQQAMIDELRRQCDRDKGAKFWALKNGFSEGMVSQVLNGKTSISTNFAKAMGFAVHAKKPEKLWVKKFITGE